MTADLLDDRYIELLTDAHRRLVAAAGRTPGGVSVLTAVVDHPTRRRDDGRPALLLEAPWAPTVPTGDGLDPVVVLVCWYAAAIRRLPDRPVFSARLRGILVGRVDPTVPDDPAALFDPDLAPAPTATCELFLLDGGVAVLQERLDGDGTAPVATCALDELDNVDEVLAPDCWLAPILAAIRETPVPEQRIRAFADYLHLDGRHLSLERLTDVVVEHTAMVSPPPARDGLIGPVGTRITPAAWELLSEVVHHPYDLDAVLAGHLLPHHPWVSG